MAKVEGAAERLLLVEWGGWANDVDGNVWNPDCITDARPLIVLDLNGERSVTLLARHLRNGYWNDIADQIEAQTKPVRIPEPGLWGVVEAGGYRWVRYSLAGCDDWVDLLGKQNEWDVLIDPTLVREGIEP